MPPLSGHYKHKTLPAVVCDVYSVAGSDAGLGFHFRFEFRAEQQYGAGDGRQNAGANGKQSAQC